MRRYAAFFSWPKGEIGAVPSRGFSAELTLAKHIIKRYMLAHAGSGDGATARL